MGLIFVKEKRKKKLIGSNESLYVDGRPLLVDALRIVEKIVKKGILRTRVLLNVPR